MQQSPLIGVMKILAFIALAFMVWLTWWQADRREQRLDETRKQISGIKNDITKMRGAVDKLTSSIRSGIVVTGQSSVSPGSSGSSGVAKKNIPPPPAYLSEKAKALWGRYENYFTPEDDPIEIPPLDTKGADVDGRINCWFLGKPAAKVNWVTGNDSNMTTQVREYCESRLGRVHDRNPSLWKPESAVRVEVNREDVGDTPKFCEWVVFLRDDMYWHTPQVDLTKYPHLAGEHKVTSRDFKFRLDLILNEDVDCASLRNYYSECAGIEIVDDYCFIVRWKKPQYNAITFTLDHRPAPYFVFAFDEKGREYDDSEVGAAFNTHWMYRDFKFVGHGPYYVAEFNPSSHVLLRRFDRYFGETSLPKEIRQEMFPAAKMAVDKMESGDFDYVRMSAKDWDKKVNSGKETPFNDGSMEEEWAWDTGYYFIAWKTTHKIFRDVRVRRAMTMACDRNRVRDVIQHGKSKVLTGPQHVNSPFNPPDLEPLPFDLEASAALLKEAGWEDTDGDGVLDKQLEKGAERTDFRFVATLPSGSERADAIFKMFKEDLRKIGVEMTITRMAWAQFGEEALDGRSFECTTLGWNGSGWESDLYQIWHSSQIKSARSSNFIEFNDKVTDELIERLRATFDVDERVRLQRKAHKRIAELQPYTFLTTRRIPWFSWKHRVGNFAAGTRYAVRPAVRMTPMFVKSPD